LITFKNIDSLKPVQPFDEKAGKALKDSSRTKPVRPVPSIVIYELPFMNWFEQAKRWIYLLKLKQENTLTE
jgi:hypothetical protein